MVVGSMDRLSQARNLVGIATPGRIMVLLEEDPDIPPVFSKTKVYGKKDKFFRLYVRFCV